MFIYTPYCIIGHLSGDDDNDDDYCWSRARREGVVTKCMQSGVGGINYSSRIPKLPRQRGNCVQAHEEQQQEDGKRVWIIHIGSFDLHIQFTYYSVAAGSQCSTTSRPGRMGSCTFFGRLLDLDGRIISHQKWLQVSISTLNNDSVYLCPVFLSLPLQCPRFNSYMWIWIFAITSRSPFWFLNAFLIRQNDSALSRNGRSRNHCTHTESDDHLGREE